ncbi:hypothetical protein CSE16_10545 [Solibacillus sp. R5-41]|nr:hypothetical protein CSE16_10545 [Solibacillus sp. R5-41]
MNVGHIESTIRDQQNYRLFIQLLSENIIPAPIIHHYVNYLSADNGLLFELNDTDTSTVIQRSFSALFLTAIVNADRQLGILTKEEVEQLTTAAIELFSKEQDFRSYIDEMTGWAHSIAHTADLICALISHPYFNIRFTSHILQAIRTNLWKGYVFQDDEEERFVKIVEALIAKGIEEALFIEWVEQLFDRLEMVAYEQGYNASWFKARTNILNMMKTLYFFLKFSNHSDKLRGIVSIFIQRWLKLT